jgi:ABC-type transport system involved in cytochrome c biogenesis permease subunit
MANDALAAIAASTCFLVAALAYARSEEAGSWLGATGAILLAGSLAARGMKAGYWPLTTRYEFALAFALATAISALLLGRWCLRARQMPAVSTAPTPRAAAMVLASTLVAVARLVIQPPERTRQALPLVLQTIWQSLHATTAASAYGMLALAGVAGAVWLLQKTDQGVSQWLLARAVGIGYPLLTLSLLLGLVWASEAWGRPWDWDIKEMSTLLTWATYTSYWPVRRFTRQPERWTAPLVVIGLGLVLFTFLGVGWLVQWTRVDSLYPF